MSKTERLYVVTVRDKVTDEPYLLVHVLTDSAANARKKAGAYYTQSCSPITLAKLREYGERGSALADIAAKYPAIDGCVCVAEVSRSNPANCHVID